MSAILNTVNSWMFTIYAAIIGFKFFVINEFRRIKNDESGIEVVQVVIILLIVILIAAALWIFLSEYITGLLDSIFGNAPKPTQFDDGGFSY